MKVLLLGGTRFTGRALAQALSGAGHDVTVASRRAAEVELEGVEGVAGERDELLVKLAGRQFDETIDFIAYEPEGIFAATRSVRTQRYTLISSTWLPRYLGLDHAAEIAEPEGASLPDGLPSITYRYLRGKLLAETAVHEARAAGQDATVVRLPVMTGPGDHTRRLHFYRSRLCDSDGLLVVGDGAHEVQIASHLDLARALGRWVELHDRPKAPVWEATPPAELTWRRFLETLAENDGVSASLHLVSEDRLRGALPELLEADPLWRERPIALSENNLFRMTGTAVTPVARWMEGLEPVDRRAMEPSLRARERDLIRRLAHVD